MSFGVVANVAIPAAHAAPHAYAAGEEGDDVQAPVHRAASSGGGGGGGGGGGSTPSGGASTGAGGMAQAASFDVAPFVAVGGAGALLLGAGAGASALARRRRTVSV
jgi:hypothetical protein